MNKQARCMIESDIDTTEIALKKRAEELFSEGRVDEADDVYGTIERLDDVPVCEE